MARDKSETNAQKAPRVIFRGEGEPPRSVQIGMQTIELPDGEAQRKGFECEDARLLITNVEGYKRLIR